MRNAPVWLRPILALCFLALLAGSHRYATSAAGSRVRELAPGVFFWQGERPQQQQANCGWIVFKDYVLVIDANFPWGAREILRELRKTTSKPVRFVFDTHYHSDHTFGNSVFVDAGAAVVCSSACGSESREKNVSAWRSFVATDENGNRLSGPGYSLSADRLEHPTILFDREMAFDDGNQRLEIKLVGPAHTRGDAVAYLPKQRILFAGDLCVNWHRGNNVGDPDGDPENWIRVLDAFRPWDIQTVIPGHGFPGGREILQRQRDYLADLWTQVTSGIQAGRTLDQILSRLDVSRHPEFSRNTDPRFHQGAARAMYRKATSVK